MVRGSVYIPMLNCLFTTEKCMCVRACVRTGKINKLTTMCTKWIKCCRITSTWKHWARSNDALQEVQLALRVMQFSQASQTPAAGVEALLLRKSPPKHLPSSLFSAKDLKKKKKWPGWKCFYVSRVLGASHHVLPLLFLEESSQPLQKGKKRDQN